MLTSGADFSYSAWYNFGVADITNTTDRYFVLETTGGNVVGDSNTLPVALPNAWTASIGLRDLDTATTPDDVQVFSHGPNSVAVGSTVLTPNVWQNIIVTFDADGGTNNDGVYNAFLNGTLFATRDDAIATAVEGLVIGGHRAGTGRNFQGLIDDVAFFDTVLTPSEITFLQNNAIPEPSAALLGGLGALVLLRRRNR